MPIIDYWIVEARNQPTLHFIEDCPACPASAAEVIELEMPEDPEVLADDLGAHACGTCLRMFAANKTDGFLFGSVTPKRRFVIWRDRIEYEAHGFLGIGARNLVVPTDEIDGVNFVTPVRLVLETSQGEIDVSVDRPAQGELAREAFRRLGWSFDEG